jgi:hypothetical protein
MRSSAGQAAPTAALGVPATTKATSTRLACLAPRFVRFHFCVVPVVGKNLHVQTSRVLAIYCCPQTMYQFTTMGMSLCPLSEWPDI